MVAVGPKPRLVTHREYANTHGVLCVFTWGCVRNESPYVGL